MAEPTDAGAHPERLPVARRAEVLARHRAAVAAGEPGLRRPRDRAVRVHRRVPPGARRVLCERLPALPVPLMRGRQPLGRDVALRSGGDARTTRACTGPGAARPARRRPAACVSGRTLRRATSRSCIRRTRMAVVASRGGRRVVDRLTGLRAVGSRPTPCVRREHVRADALMRGTGAWPVLGSGAGVELPLWSPARDVVGFAAGGVELFARRRAGRGTSRGAGRLIERVDCDRASRAEPVDRRADPAADRHLTAGRPDASGGADLVGAVAGAGDHVLHALDRRAGQHGADEVDLARARLAVPLRDGPDRAVVLDDAVHAGARRVRRWRGSRPRRGSW